MQKNLYFVALALLLEAFILPSCNQNHAVKSINSSSKNDSVKATWRIEIKADFDTVFTISNNTFHLQFWRDTSIQQSGEGYVNNSFLLVTKGSEKVLADSMFSSELYNGANIEDLNSDGNNDIAIGKETGGNMANEFIYYYLYNKMTGSFNKIDGIDTLPTIFQDSTGLVISQAFYGDKINRAFFYINRDFKLIALQEEIETVLFDDSTNFFDETFNKALKKYKAATDK